MTAIRRGVKRFKMSSLKLPGEVRERMREERVAKLAESMDATGGQPMEPIVVRSDGTLIAGRDRAAALLLRKCQETDGVVYDGDDADIERLMLVENVHRRYDHAERSRSLARLVEMSTKPVPPQETPQRGRPPTPEGTAIREVSRSTGVPEPTVRRAVAESRPDTEPTPPPRLSAPIRTLGLPVPPDIAKATIAVHAFLNAQHKALVRMQADVTAKADELGDSWNLPQTVREDLHRAASTIRSAMPAAICPWCKLTEHRAKCSGCGTLGWVTHQQMGLVDSRLLLEGKDAGIYLDGEWVALADLDGSI